METNDDGETNRPYLGGAVALPAEVRRKATARVGASNRLDSGRRAAIRFLAVPGTGVTIDHPATCDPREVINTAVVLGVRAKTAPRAAIDLRVAIGAPAVPGAMAATVHPAEIGRQLDQDGQANILRSCQR